MTPAERTEYIERMNRAAADRAALAVPAPTGRGELADAAAAEDHYSRVDAAWSGLDQQLRYAQAAAGLFPAAADAAELANLERRTAAAWASRELAKRHRDRLMGDLGLFDSPGYGLPPGEGYVPVRRKTSPGTAPGLRPSAAALAAAMSAASEANEFAELHRLMLVAATSPWLAAATWRTLADELASQMATTGTGS